MSERRSLVNVINRVEYSQAFKILFNYVSYLFSYVELSALFAIGITIHNVWTILSETRKAEHKTQMKIAFIRATLTD